MSTRKIIKLMADYQCFPLWAAGGEVGNVDPATLPISEATRTRLADWAAAFDRTLKDENPRESGFEDPAEAAAFEKEGSELWRALLRELSPEYTVVYYSRVERRVLSDDDPDAAATEE
jgi:hypothetical protein